jgi:NDP-sugar pyrophosphorylase family protein
VTPAGIIAAGEGSRLRAHAPVVKPMIPVAGRPLIHWIVGSLSSAGCREVTVLTNSRGTAVPPSLSAAFPAIRFSFLRADTASSFESFRLVSLALAEKAERFLVSTTDALVPPAAMSAFLDACLRANADAGLALTSFVDDEKPLWADLDAAGRVIALGDAARQKRRVTSGLYFMTRAAAARLPRADAHGRLRDFLAQLARETTTLGVPLSKTLDVDRPEDLAAAEAFLTTEMK